MCGRYNNHLQVMHDWANLLKDWPSDEERKYNTAPTTTIPIVTADGVKMARWGMVPSWSKEFKTKYSTINARIESVKASRLYKSAWEASRTCIVPAAGYYEWREENGVKQPYYIYKPNDLIAFAGLWEPWSDKMSCTILTEEAFGNTAELHSRMPVTLSLNKAEDWLNRGTEVDPTGCGVNFELEYYPVSRDVNSVRNEGPQLIEPLAQ